MELHPLKLIAQCPLCRTSYTDAGITLVEERVHARMFHCACQRCGHALLALVMEIGGYLSSVGIVTDLQSSEVIRLSQETPISADACLWWYDYLEHKSKEFCRVLSSFPRP